MVNGTRNKRVHIYWGSPEKKLLPTWPRYIGTHLRRSCYQLDQGILGLTWEEVVTNWTRVYWDSPEKKLLPTGPGYIGAHLRRSCYQLDQGILGLTWEEVVTNWTGVHWDLPEKRLLPTGPGYIGTCLRRGCYQLDRGTLDTHLRRGCYQLDRGTLGLAWEEVVTNWTRVHWISPEKKLLPTGPGYIGIFTVSTLRTFAPENKKAFQLNANRPYFIKWSSLNLS